MKTINNTKKGFSNESREKLKTCFNCANKSICKKIGFTDATLNMHFESANEYGEKAFTFDDIIYGISFIGKTIIHPKSKKQYKIKCISPNILDCSFGYENQKGHNIYLTKKQMYMIKFA
jgi:hypothetical protein